MRLEISLARCNGDSAIAAIQTEDDELEICERSSARQACMDGAAALRRAADKLERLAEEDKPYNADTQTRINRDRVSANPPKSAGRVAHPLD